MSVVDGVLEDIIPEDFLLKLSEIRVIDVRIDHPNEVSSTSLLAGPEVNLSVCHGTSAPEGPSGPKGALAPKVASVDSPSAASMGVHVGSPMPQTDDVVVTSSVVPIGPADQTTLEVRCSSTKNLMGVSSAEFPMGVSSVEIPMGVVLSLRDPDPSMLVPAQTVASTNVIASRSASVVLALGFLLFLSNLQVLVSCLALPCIYQWVFRLLALGFIECLGPGGCSTGSTWSSST